MGNQRGFAPLIIVLIVITLLAGGFLAWQYWKVPKEEEPAVTPTAEGQLIVKQSGGAGLLISECGDKSYITEKADYIVEGIIEKVESKLDERGKDIFTYTDLKIENYVKGTPFKEDKLQIVTPGGCVGDYCLIVEDQPIFHEDKRVRIYFEEINGEFLIFCGESGVEEI